MGNRDREQMKGREEESEGRALWAFLQTSRIGVEREEEEEGKKEQEDAY